MGLKSTDLVVCHIQVTNRWRVKRYTLPVTTLKHSVEHVNALIVLAGIRGYGIHIVDRVKYERNPRPIHYGNLLRQYIKKLTPEQFDKFLSTAPDSERDNLKSIRQNL